jgi:hypothetical protein
LALKTVTGKLTNASTGAGGVVFITLSQPAVITGTQEIIPSTIPVVVDPTLGTYSVQLQANNDLTPNGTYYTVEEIFGGSTYSFTIQVPTTAGPFVITNLLTSPPTIGASPNHVSTLTVDGGAGSPTIANGNVAARTLTVGTGTGPYTPWPSALAGSFNNLVFAPAPSGGDDLAALQALATSMAGVGGLTLAFTPGTWKLSAPLNVDGINVLLDSATVIQAGSVFAGPLVTNTKTVAWDTQWIAGGGLLDCNDKADNGLYLRYFRDPTIRDVRVLRPNSHAIILGDPTATATSYGAKVQNAHVHRTSGGSVPAGSYGIWTQYATDCEINVAEVVGQDVGIRNDQGSNRFIQAHVWGYSGHVPTTCFDDNSDGTWTHCFADTPSTYGYHLRQANSVLIAPRVFNNSIYGVDNTMVACQVEAAAAAFVSIGGRFNGADNTHRIATDFAGTISGQEIVGHRNTNVTSVLAGLPTILSIGRISTRLATVANDANVLAARNSSGTYVLNVNSAGGTERVEVVNNAPLRGYSDAFTTKTWEILGTGAASFLSVLGASPFKATAALAETIPRNSTLASQTPMVSGTLYLAAIALPANLTIGHLAFVTGNAGITGPQNWWMALYDNNLAQLAITADQTSTALGTFALASLPVANIASGASATFTTTYSGLHYIGFMVKCSGAVPTLIGSAAGTTVPGLAPVLYGLSDTLQSTPPGFPHTATAITVNTAVPYAYVAA